MINTAILVDDEPLLSDYLEAKLAQFWPQLKIVGRAQNGSDALDLAQRCQPDIIFLDIQMPGMTGLDVARALPGAPQIVFVTAYDDHALEAFDTAAVDYLLKPVSDERLLGCIDRLQRGRVKNPVELLSLIKSMQEAPRDYIHWIRSGQGETTELVAAGDVIYFKADHKYTSVFTAEREYIVRLSIKELEARLDPAQFWRIHRSLIVRIDQIVSARRDFRGRYNISLRERPEQLRSSQSYGHLFRKM